MVTGQDVVDKAAEFIGQRDSNGIDGNGPHPWAFWCEAFVEMVHEQLGLHRVRRETALAHAAAVALKAGRAPIGAMVFFGTEFFQDGGHVAISTGDGGCIGTVTDGMGVDRRELNETTRGYLGWAYHPGVRPGAVPQPSRGRYAVAVGVANIRQGPGRRFPVVGTLAADAVAEYDRSEAGESVDGNPWWLRLGDGRGWVHSSLLRVAPPGPGRYTVEAETANIRQGPGRTFPVVGTVSLGTVAEADEVVSGEPVDGNPWWLRLRDRHGWIHSSLVMAA